MANAAEYGWPSKDKAKVIGTDHLRIDGIEKATGAAKYTYDINLDKQLVAVALSTPHGHIKIKSLDVSEAKKTKGVVHVEVLTTSDPPRPYKAGDEINWEGELLVVVAAENEGAAREGVDNIKFTYDRLPVFVADDDLEAAQ